MTTCLWGSLTDPSSLSPCEVMLLAACCAIVVLLVAVAVK